METTKVLAAAGAVVIVPARDTEKAEKNLQGIANVELETMDLIDPYPLMILRTSFYVKKGY